MPTDTAATSISIPANVRRNSSIRIPSFRLMSGFIIAQFPSGNKGRFFGTPSPLHLGTTRRQGMVSKSLHTVAVLTVDIRDPHYARTAYTSSAGLVFRWSRRSGSRFEESSIL